MNYSDQNQFYPGCQSSQTPPGGQMQLPQQQPAYLQPQTYAQPQFFNQTTVPGTGQPQPPYFTSLLPQGAVTGTAPAGQTAPITPLTQPMPVTVESMQYINGFLRTQIGKRVTVNFLIGTNTSVDRTGTLLAVGSNYILLNEVETDDILVCDFFSIKFVTIYY
jgi:hypothetical protein